MATGEKVFISWVLALEIGFLIGDWKGIFIANIFWFMIVAFIAFY